MDKFDDIKSPLLQTYNRTMIFRNLLEDFGLAPAEDYLDQFNISDKNNISLMYKLIKAKGRDYVISVVRQHTVFEEDLLDEVASGS